MTQPAGLARPVDVITCAVCGKRLNLATRLWSIVTGKDYCRSHYPQDGAHQ